MDLQAFIGRVVEKSFLTVSKRATTRRRWDAELMEPRIVLTENVTYTLGDSQITYTTQTQTQTQDANTQVTTQTNTQTATQGTTTASASTYTQGQATGGTNAGTTDAAVNNNSPRILYNQTLGATGQTITITAINLPSNFSGTLTLGGVIGNQSSAITNTSGFVVLTFSTPVYGSASARVTDGNGNVVASASFFVN